MLEPTCATIGMHGCFGNDGPKIVSHPHTSSTPTGWVYLLETKNFDPLDPDSTVVWEDMPSWAFFDQPSMTAYGLPTTAGTFEMWATVTNAQGTDKQKIILTVTDVVTASTYWGRSTSTVLTEGEILALSESALKSTITEGTYSFESDTQPTYLFVHTADGMGVPGPRSAGKGWMSGAFLSAMAGVADGYTSEINGWYYLPITVNGIPGKLWRSLNPIVGAQVWTVTQ